MRGEGIGDIVLFNDNLLDVLERGFGDTADSLVSWGLWTITILGWGFVHVKSYYNMRLHFHVRVAPSLGSSDMSSFFNCF